MAPKVDPMSIRPWQYLSLSTLMLLVSVLTITDFPFRNVSNAPVFTVFREPESGLHILQHRRMQVPNWFYMGLKGAPSALWCVLIPLQHNATIRKRWPWIHRLDGYIAAFLSFELGVAGYWMLYRGWLTSHPDPLHLHSLYGMKIPPFVWPTFATSIIALGPLYFLSLFKMVFAARARRIATHRKWAVLHSMSGYTIAIERALSIGVNMFGRLLHLLPDTIKYGRLGLPTRRADVLDAEVSALAWTVAGANVIVGLWAYYGWSQKSRSGGSKQRSKAV